MNLLIYGEKNEDIKTLAKKAGFNLVDENPEIVASFGGDGTFMLSEKSFPQIPKFFLKNSRICKKCHDLPNHEILEKIQKGEYEVEEKIKVEAKANGKQLVGLSEIIVHNDDPRRAIRYEIHINGKQVGKEIIGDGVVISTPYGSTGYYRSITDSFFEIGIGVAFNNSIEQSDHMVLKEDSEIIIKIMRGKAIAYGDNSEDEIELFDGDEIVIKKSEEVARVIKII